MRQAESERTLSAPRSAGARRGQLSGRRRAISELSTAQDSLVAIARWLVAARERYELARKSYAAGAVDVVQLSESTRQLLEAELREVTATLNAHVARARLTDCVARPRALSAPRVDVRGRRLMSATGQHVDGGGEEWGMGTTSRCAKFLVACFVVVGFAAPASANPARLPPGADKVNILFIMGDDIGWMQPSIYHRGLMVGETPNIDRIGHEGAMFVDYVAMQSCTSGRNAFFTGMYPLRTGMIPPQLPGQPDVPEARARRRSPSSCSTSATTPASSARTTSAITPTRCRRRTASRSSGATSITSTPCSSVSFPDINKITDRAGGRAAVQEHADPRRGRGRRARSIRRPRPA